MEFAGELLAEMMPVSDVVVPATFAGGWFNTSFSIPAEMWPQRQRRQEEYNIVWAERDMNAAWLGNRLLIYPYILQPNNMSQPRMWINDVEVPMTSAYNSRGQPASRALPRELNEIVPCCFCADF